MQKQPPTGASGLEGLAGTPQRVESPAAGAPASASNMDDLMGVFGSGGGAPATASGGDDLMNGFASLDLGGPSQPQQQMGGTNTKKNNEDILGLF
jgi:AP-1 complex subunit beta-1